MNSFAPRLLAAAFLLAAPLSPALAQTAADFGASAVTSACRGSTASSQACQIAVNAFVARVQSAGLSPVVQDNILADLVRVLGDGAALLPTESRSTVAEAIRTLSTGFSDADRGLQVASIADAVAAGVPFSTEPLDQIASPA